MFTERELLILSLLVDRAIVERPAAFFSHTEADMLGIKIYNVLKATRREKEGV
jgi:hypothetical protein